MDFKAAQRILGNMLPLCKIVKKSCGVKPSDFDRVIGVHTEKDGIQHGVVLNNERHIEQLLKDPSMIVTYQSKEIIEDLKFHALAYLGIQFLKQNQCQDDLPEAFKIFDAAIKEIDAALSAEFSNKPSKFLKNKVKS